MTEPGSYDEAPDSTDRDIPVRSVFFASTSAWVLDPSHGEFFDIAGPRRHSPVNFPTRHGEMLRELLGPPTQVREHGRAWLRIDATDPDSVWSDADDTAIITIEQAMEDLAAAMRAAPDGVDDAQSRQLITARHRVFLDPDRVRALGFTDESDVSIVLDLRPRRVEAQLRCHLTTWVFSGPAPADQGFCPPEVREAGIVDAAGPRRTVEQIHRILYGAAFNVETLLVGRFVPVEFRGHWRRYGFPEFWFALPEVAEADPVDYLPPDARGVATAGASGISNGERLSGLVVTALDIRDPSDPAVARSVLNADLLVLRRIKREPTSERWGRVDESWSDVPLYLTIPGGAALKHGDAATFVKLVRLVTELTDMEVGFSNTLYQLEADLEIWRNHTELFNIVCERGMALWDALSTHLPARRHGSLRKVHRAIELLHQLLMQGLADLAHIEAIVGTQVAEVDDAIDRIGDDFDREFAERRIGGGPSVRHQLTRTYLYERVNRFGGDTEKETQRVKRAYNDLINTIGAAFDERRVREFDVLNRSSVLFGVFAAVVGLIVALPQIVNFVRPFNLSHDSFAGRAIVAVPIGLVALILVYLAGIVVRWIGSVGRLGSRSFRQMYNGRRRGSKVAGRSGVWGFLRDASTANLETLAHSGRLDDAYDRRLAEDFAVLWDNASRLADFTRGDTPGKDIVALARHVEEWGLHGLLLTERAWRLHRFPLPVLTCLYVAATEAPRSFFELGYLPRANVVAYVDFARSLMRIGFTWMDTEKIRKWLSYESRPSAADALARVRSLGLKSSMTAEERRALMSIVDGS
jgi:hypothetical protein